MLRRITYLLAVILLCSSCKGGSAQHAKANKVVALRTVRIDPSLGERPISDTIRLGRLRSGEIIAKTIRIENLKKGLHVMVACPGFTASNVRFSALTADGSQQGSTPREEGKMMTAEQVAHIVARGIARRKRLCLMEAEGRATHFVKKFAPALVDKIFYWVMSKEPDSPFK